MCMYGQASGVPAPTSPQMAWYGLVWGRGWRVRRRVLLEGGQGRDLYASPAQARNPEPYDVARAPVFIIFYQPYPAL